MNSGKIYIIIVNYRKWEDTVECLESLIRCSYPFKQINVCDNGSGDGSLDRIEAWAQGKIAGPVDRTGLLTKLTVPPVAKPVAYEAYTLDLLKSASFPLSDKPLILVDSGANLGFAGGNNAGLRFAQLRNDFSYIWFLNNDTVIEPDSLDRLVEEHERCRKKGIRAGIIGSKLLYYDRPDTIQAVGGIYYNTLAYSKHIGAGQPDDGRFDREKLRMDYIVGASMLVPKEFLDEVGPMSEDYFIYFEESDWMERGRRKGWTISYAWRSRVYHKEGASIGANKLKRTKSDFAVYYFFRNTVLFTLRYHPLCMVTVAARIAATLVYRLFKRDISKARTMLRAVTGKPYIQQNPKR